MKPHRPALRALRAAHHAGVSLAGRQAQAHAAAAHLALHLPRLAAIAATYAPIADEFDPAACDAVLIGAGWTLAFPRVPAPNAALAFHACQRDALLPGYRGIPEPPAGAPAAAPSLLLIPLLACDPAGNRVGYGKGHYDRTLAALRAAGPVVAVGVGWDVQLVQTFAPEAHDQPLDALLTPAGFRRFR